VARAASSVLKLVPLAVSIFFARAFGALLYHFNLKKRVTAYKNIKTAFPQYPLKKIRQITRANFMNSAQHFVEVFYLPWMDARYLKHRIELEGIEEIKEKMKNKKGTIFLGSHQGSWEVVNVILGQTFRDYNYTILARSQPSLLKLSKMLNEYRQKYGCRVIDIGERRRLIVEHLKNRFFW